VNDKIKEALAKLDIDNDDHWTTEGLPRLDVMKDLLGVAASRADITAAQKGFSRKTPNLEDEKPELTGSGEPAVEEATPEASPGVETTEEVEETEATKDVDEDSDEAIESEVAAARKNLDKANARYKAAVRAMDVVIMRRSKEANLQTQASLVKAFQESQRKQREKSVARQRAMAEAIATSKGFY
jgi:hypothetical protein